MQKFDTKAIGQELTKKFPYLAKEQDSRVYLPIGKYLAACGLCLGEAPDGQLLLLGSTSRKQTHTVQLSELLRMCIRWTHSQQSSAKTMFQRMVAEEDEEELLILSELTDTYNQHLKKQQAKASTSIELPNSNSRLVKEQQAILEWGLPNEDDAL